MPYFRITESQNIIIVLGNVSIPFDLKLKMYQTNNIVRSPSNIPDDFVTLKYRVRSVSLVLLSEVHDQICSIHKRVAFYLLLLGGIVSLNASMFPLHSFPSISQIRNPKLAVLSSRVYARYSCNQVQIVFIVMMMMIIPVLRILPVCCKSNVSYIHQKFNAVILVVQIIFAAV